jgi:hypothetical protein
MTEPQPPPSDPNRERIRKAEDSPPLGGSMPSPPAESGIQLPLGWGLSKEPHPLGVPSAGGPHPGSPPRLQHDGKGWLAVLAASLGFLAGGIGGGWVATAVYQASRGGTGGYYGEIGIAMSMIFWGGCIGAVCGGFGGYLIGGEYIEQRKRSS